jgi:hypothetical protein
VPLSSLSGSGARVMGAWLRRQLEGLGKKDGVDP